MGRQGAAVPRCTVASRCTACSCQTRCRRRCLQGGNVTRRRGLVCAFLGLGECDGKQLLRQLNRFGFTMADVERALAWAECQGVGRGSGGNECG